MMRKHFERENYFRFIEQSLLEKETVNPVALDYWKSVYIVFPTKVSVPKVWAGIHRNDKKYFMQIL